MDTLTSKELPTCSLEKEETEMALVTILPEPPILEHATAAIDTITRQAADSEARSIRVLVIGGQPRPLGARGSGSRAATTQGSRAGAPDRWPSGRRPVRARASP